MQRQGHLVLDLFESDTKSDPNCVLRPEQSNPEFTVEEYKQVLKTLSSATTLVFNDAPEAYEAFTPALVEVLFDRQIMRANGNDADLLHAIEDQALNDVCEQLEFIYQKMTTPILPGMDAILEPTPEFIKHQSVHGKIVDELSKHLTALLSKTMCLHTARFRAMKEEIEQSLSVKDAYLVIYNARNGHVEPQAELLREQSPDKQNQSWFGGFFAGESQSQTKSKLATPPNQTWFGGFFRRMVYDNLDDVYGDCLKVFEKYKDYDEVKRVLEEFPCRGAVAKCN